MKVNDSTLKGNQPELLVDFNGNPVQHAWVLGGRTLTIAADAVFKAESTLMRIANSGTTVARIKVKYADYSSIPVRNTGNDVGFPILPGTSVVCGVIDLGLELEVSGGSVDVTFNNDRRLELTA